MSNSYHIICRFYNRIIFIFEIPSRRTIRIFIRCYQVAMTFPVLRMILVIIWDTRAKGCAKLLAATRIAVKMFIAPWRIYISVIPIDVSTKSRTIFAVFNLRVAWKVYLQNALVCIVWSVIKRSSLIKIKYLDLLPLPLEKIFDFCICESKMNIRNMIIRNWN